MTSVICAATGIYKKLYRRARFQNHKSEHRNVVRKSVNGCYSCILKEMARKNNIATMFKNEHIMYTEVLPKLVQLQRDVDIAENNLFKFAK